MIEVPSYVSIKSWHRGVKTLISANEGVFLDGPDLAMLVPSLQVSLQVSGISRHTCGDGRLNLTDLFILLCRGTER